MVHFMCGRYLVGLWVMAVVAAACSAPGSIGKSLEQPAMPPNIAPTVSTTRVAHQKPGPVEYQIALRILQSETWVSVPQADARRLEAAMAARETPPVFRRGSLPLRPPLWISAGEARALAEAHFRPQDVDLMLRVADCESGNADGVPSELNVHAKNPYSTASGAFQHLRGWWSGKWGSFGPFDPFNPAESFAAAAYLLYEAGGIGNWNASKACWG